MNTKPTLLITTILVMLALMLFGPQYVSFADSVPAFPLGDVSAAIAILLPVNNGSYVDSVLPLNVSIRFTVYESTCTLVQFHIKTLVASIV